MSGIAGILYRDGRPVDQTDIEKMLSAMSYRGPDGDHVWIRGPTGLGHCMLRATPESIHEILPYEDTNTGLVIVSDARIDNREELFKRLQLAPGQFTNVPDSWIILEAYKKWKNDCVSYLLGDFAFCILNKKDNLLFCGRDVFGFKPFYYCNTNDFFAFASDVNALLALQMVPRDIFEPRIADFLLGYGYLEGFDEECTFRKEIFRLPPANTAVVNRKGIRFCKYWTLEPREPIRLKSDDEYIDAFTDLLSSAISCRLRGARLPASMLSGGMDSSSIVALGRGRDEPLYTYSAAVLQSTCQETKAIRRVMNQGGVKGSVFFLHEMDSVHEEIIMAQSKREDLFDTWMLIPQLMFCLASKDGHNVLLSGAAGDILFVEAVKFLNRDITKGNWIAAIKQGLNIRNQQPSRLISDMLLPGLYQAVVPQSVKNWRCGTRLAMAVSNSLLSQEFAAEINLQARLEDGFGTTINTGNIVKDHSRAVTHPQVVAATERYDRIASSCSIEHRDPYRDKRLVEFCLNMPKNQHVGHGWNKFIMRKAMAGKLPNSVTWRKTDRSQHLGGKYNKMFLAPMDELINDYLENKLSIVKPYVDENKVRAKWREARQNTKMVPGEQIWEVISLGLWLENRY